MFRLPTFNSGEGRNVASEKEEMRKMGMEAPKPHASREALKPRMPKAPKPRKMGRR
jgi:hypothetical protein